MMKSEYEEKRKENREKREEADSERTPFHFLPSNIEIVCQFDDTSIATAKQVPTSGTAEFIMCLIWGLAAMALFKPYST